jgi:hypothetical protein
MNHHVSCRAIITAGLEPCDCGLVYAAPAPAINLNLAALCGVAFFVAFAFVFALLVIWMPG